MPVHATSAPRWSAQYHAIRVRDDLARQPMYGSGHSLRTHCWFPEFTLRWSTESDAGAARRLLHQLAGQLPQRVATEVQPTPTVITAGIQRASLPTTILMITRERLVDRSVAWTGSSGAVGPRANLVPPLPIIGASAWPLSSLA